MLSAAFINVKDTKSEKTDKYNNVKSCALSFSVINYSSTGIVKRLIYDERSLGMINLYINLGYNGVYQSSNMGDAEVILKMYGVFDHIDIVDGFDNLIRRVDYDPNSSPWNDYVLDTDGFSYCNTDNKIVVY